VIRAIIVAALIISAASPSYSRSLGVSVTAAQTADLQLFATEGAAQVHCPNDTVVWLNTNSGIYHEKGLRWYGNTKHGAYVCRKEANAAGDRDTRNGQ
jgi:hypothetical protein